jgi:hypothetical protein
MGFDLFNACVFCAATLFNNVDFAPPRGYSAEVAASYVTLQRQLEAGSTALDDRSDVTAKLVAVGMRWTRMAEGDLGAGTPVSEWRLRFAFATSHDEASQSKPSPPQLVATGAGRYENFLAMFRKSVGAADSVEFGIEHRRHKITDLLNIGGSPLQFTSERDMIAEHIDFGLGWRHRWKNFELAGAATGSRFEGKTDTPPSGILGAGTIFGGRLELRARKGPWTASLLAQAVSGDLTVSDRYGPTAQTEYKRPGWVEALTLSLQRRVQKFDVMFSASLDRSRLPFVSLAVLGSEQLAVDSGYHPDSRTRQWFFDLAIRHEVIPGVFPRFFFRFARGSETVALADTAGLLPPRTLQIIRGGQFPPVGSNASAPEYSIGIALEAVLGPR